MVREVLHARVHRKHKVMGKILGAGKHLTLGVRGPGEKLSWGETRSSGTGGSHPGQESWSVSGGWGPYPPVLGTKGNQEGWPSWVEYRSGGNGGPHPGVDIFPDLSPRAKPYCGVKCSQGLHFPATDCGAWGARGHNPPTVQGERSSAL